jgi:hypothetical protein
LGPALRRTGRGALLIGALLTLGACAVPIGTEGAQEQGISPDAMEQIAALAAPYQDLSTVERRPGDGCYWYRHVGPVETTMLPLRTPEGNPICSGTPAES